MGKSGVLLGEMSRHLIYKERLRDTEFNKNSETKNESDCWESFEIGMEI
jgi:hypothetical protein